MAACGRVQVGCAMGCTFCATGTMGIKGELTAGEIVEQLVHARKLSSIRNVVFMGMGVRAPALHPPSDTSRGACPWSHMPLHVQG